MDVLDRSTPAVPCAELCEVTRALKVDEARDLSLDISCSPPSYSLVTTIYTQVYTQLAQEPKIARRKIDKIRNA